MIRKPRILVDVDGVLGDFLVPSCEILRELTGHPWKPEDFKTWDIFETVDKKYEKPFYDACTQPEWCRNIPPFTAAVEGMRRLQEVSNVYIVTSPMGSNPRWAYERDHWLKDHFGIPTKKVVHTAAKYLCVGEALIDDKPANIEQWMTEHTNSLGLLFDQPYNQENAPGYRVHTWEQILQVAEYLAHERLLPTHRERMRKGSAPW